MMSRLYIYPTIVRNYWHFALLLFVLCSGCKSAFKQSTIRKNQRIYGYDTDTKSSELATFKVNQPTKVTIKEDGDALYIKGEQEDLDTKKIEFNHKVILPSNTDLIPDLRALSVQPRFYYSAKEGAFKGEENGTFGYRQWRIYLQGMAIPLKFRRPTGTVAAQVESGPTLAIAPGFKHSWNWYKGSKNALGLNATSISIAFGGLVGLGVVEINSKTTQGKVADVEASKNAIVPLGFHLVGGLNNINVGVAVGWDVITGPNRSQWNYNGKMWTGVIVGLDILK